MPMRVLIIEDHVDNLDLMSYLLKAYGYATLSATDGLNGVRLVENERPELVICDIQIPGIDGYEVAKRLKSDAVLRKIPLIGVTALAMVGDRERVLAAGFDGYIAKPIAPETFVGDVESFLKPEQRRAVAKPPENVNRSDGEAEPHASVETRASSRGAILVVDNIRDNLELARSIFEPSGYTVLLAADITSAFALAKQTMPDLVLSDVNMPHGTGLELVLRMKADPQLEPVPVILISASVPRDMSGDRFLAAGAVKFLRRPIDPDVLLHEIESSLHLSRQSTS
jgi:two-component system cell cycle response regulator